MPHSSKSAYVTVELFTCTKDAVDGDFRSNLATEQQCVTLKFFSIDKPSGILKKVCETEGLTCRRAAHQSHLGTHPSDPQHSPHISLNPILVCLPENIKSIVDTSDYII